MNDNEKENLFPAICLFGVSKKKKEKNKKRFKIYTKGGEY